MTANARTGPIVIAGGSGFLGVSLATHLAGSGKSIILLSRHPPKPGGPWRHVSWDARTLGEWRRELDGASGLVNLVGRSVDCIKTPDHQDEILRSRVEATRVLGSAVDAVDSPPPVWVQMSTAHIYGDPPDVICTETPVRWTFAKQLFNISSWARKSAAVPKRSAVLVGEIPRWVSALPI